MSEWVIGPKSSVDYTQDRVSKRYVRPSSRYIHDQLLAVSTSSHPPVYDFRRESRFLEVLQKVPPQVRLVPRLYDVDSGQFPYKPPDGKAPSITIEKMEGPSHMERMNQALRKGEDLYAVINIIPRQVAALHQQIDLYKEELLDHLQWGSAPRLTQGLRLRSHDERIARLWNYVRTIIYTMSPQEEVKNLRQRGRKGSRYGVLNRDLKRYLHTKGIDIGSFSSEFVRNDAIIMYDVERGLQENAKKFLVQGKARIIHGDLGPQHLFTNGRCIDFDEVRLGRGEEDLVAALYNFYTYPRGEKSGREQQELQLMTFSFDYLEKMLGREPTSEEKVNYTTRVVETRLREMIRLFAADCRAPSSQLRTFTTGHPIYDSIADAKLRQRLLNDLFLEGFPPFLEFWSRGEGWASLDSMHQKDPKKDSQRIYKLQKQLQAIEQVFLRTGVFEGIEMNVVESLEYLLS